MKNFIYAKKCISRAMLPELVEHKRRSWQRGYEQHPPSDVNQHRKTTHVPTCCIKSETKTSLLFRYLSMFYYKSSLNVNWWEPWLIHNLVPRIMKAGSRRICLFGLKSLWTESRDRRRTWVLFYFSEETWEFAPNGVASWISQQSVEPSPRAIVRSTKSFGLTQVLVV